MFHGHPRLNFETLLIQTFALSLPVLGPFSKFLTAKRINTFPAIPPNASAEEAARLEAQACANLCGYLNGCLDTIFKRNHRAEPLVTEGHNILILMVKTALALEALTRADAKLLKIRCKRYERVWKGRMRRWVNEHGEGSKIVTNDESREDMIAEVKGIIGEEAAAKVLAKVIQWAEKKGWVKGDTAGDDS